MRGGRARSVPIAVDLWAQVPPPKSETVRMALESYLLQAGPLPAQPRGPLGRFGAGEAPAPVRKAAGMYVPDDQWEALAALPGSFSQHIEAALQAWLTDGADHG